MRFPIPYPLTFLLSLAFLLCATSPTTALDLKLKTTQATVISVTDGDTVVVRIGTKKERIRLIGIDAPESHMNRRAYTQSAQSNQDVKTIVGLGMRSSNFTQSLLPPGTTVSLEYDVEPRDRYGRVLAYLWLRDGRMVNDIILRSGYAYPLTVPPNVRYRARLSDAFSEGRRAHRGLWSPH